MSKYSYSIDDLERDGIIRRMMLADRVALNANGAACTVDELRKFDLPLLRILSRNSKTDPATARAIYSGGKPEDMKKFVDAGGKPLTGDALVEAGFEAAGYNDINKMIHAKPIGISF